MQNNQKVLMLGGGTSNSMLLRLMASSTLVPVDDVTLSDFAVNDVEASLALSFTTNEYRTANTTTTFADAFTGTSPKLTYSTAAGSNSTMVNSAGNIVWAPHNLEPDSNDITNYNVLNSASIIDSETFTTSGGSADALTGRVIPSADLNATYTVRAQIWSETDAGTAVDFGIRTTGIADDVKSITLQSTPTWEELESDLTGATQFRGIRVGSNSAVTIKIRNISVYRSDLGGMHPVPQAATGFEYYVPTNGNPEYLPRVGHHVYNGSAWVNEGLLIESEPRTNLLLNSSTLSTQSVTVEAAAHTLSFTGTGTITLSGASTDGPLTGTGTGEGNRVSLTFTPTAGSLTLTVSGTVSNAQLEEGSTPSSYMPTSGGTYTRTAQSLEVPPAEFGWPEPEFIGPELLSAFSNASWTTTTGEWTYDAANDEWDLAVPTAGSTSALNHNISVTEGSVYVATATVSNVTNVTANELFLRIINTETGTVDLIKDDGSGAVIAQAIGGDGTYTTTFVAGASTPSFQIRAGGASDGDETATLVSASVREISPLSVSIQMDGRMTYADTDTNGRHSGGEIAEVGYYSWNASSTEWISARLDTADTRTGSVVLRQSVGPVSPNDTYSPGVNVPFNIASRHGSTFVNGAADGVALTALTAPTALPDLSSTDLAIAYDFMGTIGTFRQFAGDIGDDGLEEATS